MPSTPSRPFPAATRAATPTTTFAKCWPAQDIDAVAVIVPDHWHGLMTVMAAQAGKDIYCEKPLSLTVRQGQAMVKAVRAHRPHPSDRQPLPFQPGQSSCLRAGSQRADRPG